jgi:hypothetical protein
MHNEIIKIENALSSSTSAILDRYDYALFFSLKMATLCTLYFEQLNNTVLRNKIVKHIKAKQNKSIESIPNVFMTNLINTFNKSNGRERMALGATIKELKDHLSRDLLQLFFDEQVFSMMISDRKRAYDISILIYDENVEKMLWFAWDKYNDNNCIEVLSKKSDISYLVERIEKIWANKEIKIYVKNHIIKRISAHDFSKLHFLRHTSPVSFLSACVAAKVKISDSEAISIAKSSKSIKEYSYSLWCLGALGKNSAIFELLSQSKEIERSMPPELWE